MRRVKTGESGFTLLEVASILGAGWLLLGTAVPYFGGVARRSRLKSEARTMGLVLTGARMQAMRRGDNVCVEVSTDPKRTSYRRAVVFLDTGSTAGSLDAADVVVGTAPIVEATDGLWIDAENSVSPSGAPGTADFVFTRFGSPAEGSSRKGVYLGDRAGNLIQVAIRPGLSGGVLTTKRVGFAFATRPWAWS